VSTEHPLRQIVRELDRAGIEHMLAGSFASTFHGDPRTTHDIDLVIDCEREALDRFVRQLDPARYYVSAAAADEAWRRRGQFNVVLLESGWKVDLIVRKQRPFSREEFARRQPAEIAGARVWVASAEDTIVSKLEWARAGESERQLRDVIGILEARAGELDLAYLERWVRELGLDALWQRARAAARGGRPESGG
jgi:hypothetical protein